jgi:CBS domain-containing protein
MRIEDVMTRTVHTVRPDAPLKYVAGLLVDLGISGVPVVDENGAVLGVVSEADVLQKERTAPKGRGGLLGLLLTGASIDTETKLQARTAGEAMTSPALMIGPRRPVAEAAARMLDEEVNRLPVVDDSGKLLGIVTRADLVRAFVRSDTEIANEIRQDIVLKTMWIAPEQVELAVQQGEVTVRAHVDTETEADLLEEFVHRVPGVVSVDADLTWNENGAR